jgi:hypothetical protein
MTKANITQYSSTPSSNSDINDINIAENCPASNINNAIRELMAHLKNVDTGSQALTALSVTGDLTVTGDIVSNTAGTSNFRAGVNAGDAIVSGGEKNTLVGDEAGTAITTGDNNVAVGFEALTTEDTGQNNVAIGYRAMKVANYDGAGNNVAVGADAGLSMTTGIFNTFVGTFAGDAHTEGYNNVAIGTNALGADVSSRGTTAIGTSALSSQNNTNTNAFNTAVGFGAGSEITTGTKNTIIGRYSGNQGGLDIRTSSNNIVLSDGDGNVRQHTDGINGVTHWTTNISDSDRALATGSHTIHSDVSANVALFVENSSANPFGIFIDFSDTSTDNNSNYFLKCEDGSDTGRLIIFSDGDVVNHDNAYGAISDEKLKEQITDATSQWEDIKALTVRKYKMKSDVATGDSDAHWRLGVIAQEVETAGMNGLVRDNPDMIENEDGEIVEGETSTKSVKYSILYMKAVKALQEAMARIETLEASNTALEARITALENA